MVTEKLEKSYDLWEKTETFGVEQRVDYIACLYPEGNLRADKCVFFNNEDIAEIIHRGFYG